MLVRFGKGNYRFDGSLAARVIHAASLVLIFGVFWEAL